MQAKASCMAYNGETLCLFVGLDYETFLGLILNKDFKKITPIQDYPAYMSHVNGIRLSWQQEWILSCSEDKHFQWHCSRTGHWFGEYCADAPCCCFEYDEQSKSIFVMDHFNKITELKIINQTLMRSPSSKNHELDLKA